MKQQQNMLCQPSEMINLIVMLFSLLSFSTASKCFVSQNEVINQSSPPTDNQKHICLKSQSSFVDPNLCRMGALAFAPAALLASSGISSCLKNYREAVGEWQMKISLFQAKTWFVSPSEGQLRLHCPNLCCASLCEVHTLECTVRHCW